MSWGPIPESKHPCRWRLQGALPTMFCKWVLPPLSGKACEASEMLGAGSGPDSPAFMGLLREFLPSGMWLWLGWGCVSSPALPLWESRPRSTDSF